MSLWPLSALWTSAHWPFLSKWSTWGRKQRQQWASPLLWERTCPEGYKQIHATAEEQGFTFQISFWTALNLGLLSL